METKPYSKRYRDGQYGQWFITIYYAPKPGQQERFHWIADLDGDRLCQSAEVVSTEEEALLDATNAIRLKTADLMGG